MTDIQRKRFDYGCLPARYTPYRCCGVNASGFRVAVVVLATYLDLAPTPWLCGRCAWEARAEVGEGRNVAAVAGDDDVFPMALAPIDAFPRFCGVAAATAAAVLATTAPTATLRKLLVVKLLGPARPLPLWTGTPPTERPSTARAEIDPDEFWWVALSLALIDMLSLRPAPDRPVIATDVDG